MKSSELATEIRERLTPQELDELLAPSQVNDIPTQASDEWEPPIPFDTFEPGEFPLDSLPRPIKDFTEALAESTQTPTEMAGLLSLGVISTAARGLYDVEITSDWKEPLCLYTVAIAPPGERKSAIISALSAPIYEYEAARRDFEAAEIAQNQLERRMLEKALASAESAATKPQTSRKKKEDAFDWDGTITDSQSQARQTALDLAEQLAKFEDKHPFRLLVDDTTPEKLIDLMDAQGGFIAIASAEGGIIDAMTGRYEKTLNLDVYLKAQAGDPIAVDRIGRRANHVKRPRLTMILTIQPEVLNGLMGNTTLRGRGLCGRFLYAMCRSKVGRRIVNPQPINPEIKKRYHNFISAILQSESRGVVNLSEEAHALRLEFAQTVETKLGNEWEFMQDWGGKLVGATMRIAAMLHIAESAKLPWEPHESPISGDTMQKAIAIAEYLGRHAEAVYQIMGADKDVAGAKYVLRQLEKGQCNQIARRDLLRKCRQFKSVDEILPALNLLEERGYIRSVEQEYKGTGRKPDIVLKINPKLVTNVTKRTE